MSSARPANFNRPGLGLHAGLLMLYRPLPMSGIESEWHAGQCGSSGCPRRVPIDGENLTGRSTDKRALFVVLMLCMLTGCAAQSNMATSHMTEPRGDSRPRAALETHDEGRNVAHKQAKASVSGQVSHLERSLVERELEPDSVEPPVRYAFHEPLPSAVLPKDAPAMRYANLWPAECRAEVTRQKLAFKRDRRPTPGVATALRFTEAINDVTFLAAGYKSKFGVMDCRLALTFVELTDLLREHGVARVILGTIYRNKARLRSRKLSQHAHALAADIVGFTLDDGQTMLVERDFQGEIGAPVCGPESQLKAATAAAIALRNLVCDIARRGFFHHILTPNYNAAHHDHLHVDIKRDARRSMIH